MENHSDNIEFTNKYMNHVDQGHCLFTQMGYKQIPNIRGRPFNLGGCGVFFLKKKLCLQIRNKIDLKDTKYN